MVPIRWVSGHDWSGTHRDESVVRTDGTMSAQAIIEESPGRGSIMVTVHEVRADWGLERTRGWCRATGLRAAPGRFGLDSVVAWLGAVRPEERTVAGKVSGLGQEATPVSDALPAVRRWLGTDGVWAPAGHPEALAKLPDQLREVIVSALAPAAEP